MLHLLVVLICNMFDTLLVLLQQGSNFVKIRLHSVICLVVSFLSLRKLIVVVKNLGRTQLGHLVSFNWIFTNWLFQTWLV